MAKIVKLSISDIENIVKKTIKEAEFDDFDMDELFASGIVTPEQVEAYYEQERQLAAYREAEQKEHRRRQYQELKAEFEPEPEIHA
jgi:hypothetical protein